MNVANNFINVKTEGNEMAENIDFKKIYEQTKNCMQELLKSHPQKKGSIFVIGCSSSEIGGGSIGHNSNEEIGKWVFKAADEICKKNGIYLASQCCEHLNRALVVSAECADKFGYEQVCVVPWLKGGGSFATAAYHGLKDAVVVEHVKASAGLDIGSVMIGMHLKDVAVPVHLKNSSIGKAFVVAAFSRPKLIGGERAKYQ